MKKTVFLLFFILLHVSKSLKFEARNSIDGSTFQAGSTVELVCTNKPYTGVHLFFIDSRKVFTCIASACKVTENNLESLFLFESDIESGVFTWIIHAMEMKFNGKSFECSDGSNYTHINATVTVKEKLETKNSYILPISIAAPVLIMIIVLIVCNKRITLFLKKRDSCNCSSTRADELCCKQLIMAIPISTERQRKSEEYNCSSTRADELCFEQSMMAIPMSTERQRKCEEYNSSSTRADGLCFKQPMMAIPISTERQRKCEEYNCSSTRADEVCCKQPMMAIPDKYGKAVYM